MRAKWSIRISVLSMALLLTACGSPPPRSADTTGQSVEQGPSSTPSTRTARKPGVVQKRGGGYYKDDGPGDEIPDNLDDIPDAQPRPEPLHRFANNPYVVLGKSYVPNTQLKAIRQRGIASWYGKKFHGQKTSIGEPYDMFSMTAAHPTLAIPSYAKVTSVNSGKSVVVRVTDRGPFHADRIIDLSYAAAYRLGYVNDGSTQVEVEAIVPNETAPTIYAQVKPLPPVTLPPALNAEIDEIESLVSTLANGKNSEASSGAIVASAAIQKGVFIQLGAFSSVDNAESLRSHLSRELDWLGESIQIQAGNGMHKVHLGPYAKRSDAEKVAEKIRLALGYKPTFVIR